MELSRSDGYWEEPQFEADLAEALRRSRHEAQMWTEVRSTKRARSAMRVNGACAVNPIVLDTTLTTAGGAEGAHESSGGASVIVKQEVGPVGDVRTVDVFKRTRPMKCMPANGSTVVDITGDTVEGVEETFVAKEMNREHAETDNTDATEENGDAVQFTAKQSVAFKMAVKDRLNLLILGIAGAGKSEVGAAIVKALEDIGLQGSGASPHHIHRIMMDARLKKRDATTCTKTNAAMFGLPMFDVPCVEECNRALGEDARHVLQSDDFMLLDEAALNPQSRSRVQKELVETVRPVPGGSARG